MVWGWHYWGGGPSAQEAGGDGFYLGVFSSLCVRRLAVWLLMCRHSAVLLVTMWSSSGVLFFIFFFFFCQRRNDRKRRGGGGEVKKKPRRNKRKTGGRFVVVRRHGRTSIDLLCKTWYFVLNIYMTQLNIFKNQCLPPLLLKKNDIKTEENQNIKQTSCRAAVWG